LTAKSVAAGASNSYAGDTSGNLWGWGLGGTGLLDTYATQNTPVQLTFGGPFAYVSAGLRHVVVKDTANNVWVFGNHVGDGQFYGSANSTPAKVAAGANEKLSAGLTRFSYF
jgi:hypothetical protein